MNELIEQSDTLCEAGIDLSNRNMGRTVQSWEEEAASLIFTRILSTFIAILRNTPGSLQYSTPRGIALNDISTHATLVRAIIEGYFSLHYFCSLEAPTEEKEFKKALWDHHDACERHKMLHALNEESKRMPELIEKKEVTLKNLQSCSYFHRLSDGKRKNLEKGKDFIHLEKTELCKTAKIGEGIYRSAFKYLSCFSHVSPHSVEMLSSSKEKKMRESIFRSSLNYACMFFSKSFEDFRKQFDKPFKKGTQELEFTINVFVDMLGTESSDLSKLMNQKPNQSQ